MNAAFPHDDPRGEEEFFRLMSGLCDGSSNDAERAKLERYVLSSDAAQERYLQYVHLHAALFRNGLAAGRPPGVGSRDWLAQLAGATGDAAPAPSNALPGNSGAGLPRSPVLGFLGAAVDFSLAWISSPKALALAVVGSLATYFVGLMISLALTRGPGERAGADALAQSPARVTGTADCRWPARSVPLELGSQLPAGTSRLVSGVVEIEFARGARVRIEGPAEFTQQSDQRIALARGRLLASVPRQARGFTVDTPTAEVIDLGTEFGVEVDGQGGTDLHVIRGRVEVKAVSAEGNVVSRGQRVVAGQAVRVSADGAKPTAIVLDLDRFIGARSAPMAVAMPGGQALESFDDRPIWLGNLFDDAPHTPLAGALASDRFQAVPDGFRTLGVHRVLYGGKPVQEIAPGLRFDLTNLGWQSLEPNGLRVANDAWADAAEATKLAGAISRFSSASIGDPNNVLAGAGRSVSVSSAIGGSALGTPSAVIDDAAPDATHDSSFLFGTGDVNQRLAITGFAAAEGFQTLRLFSVGADSTRSIGTVTAYCSASATSSLSAGDYETKLGTFASAGRVYRPFLVGVDASARGYFDLPVAAPAGTKSLLVEFGPVGPSGSGIRLHEIQALAGQAKKAVLRDQAHHGGGIRLEGTRADLYAPRMEEGIGMHANALLTFDLDEIRTAGGLAGRVFEFVCDRAGVNDGALSLAGDGGTVHMAVIVSNQRGVRSVLVDGAAAELAHSGDCWSIRSKIGKPLGPEGRVATWRASIVPEDKYLTLVSASAGDGDYRDHAVWAGARLEVLPEPKKKGQTVGGPKAKVERQR